MQPDLLLSSSTVQDPMDAPPVRWGVLGPGGIAHTFTEAAHEGTLSRVVAVGSRSADRGAEFATRHGVPRAHDSYEALVADPDVDAVYVSSPHSEHHAHALLALRAGKPVLVEKAFTRNLREAEEVFGVAESAGLLTAEAMWSRYLPHYDVVRRTVEAGTLGDVVALEAHHGQLLWPDGPARLSDPRLAGGALLDLGVYPLSFADHVLGGLTEVAARGTLSDEGVDVTSTVSALSPEGDDGSRRATALLWCSMAAASPPTARVVGTRARLELRGPVYTPGPVQLIDPHEVLLDAWEPEVTEHGFSYQIAEFARARAMGHLQVWSMPWSATRRVMGVMDEVRRQVGVVYPGEVGAPARTT